MAQKFRRRRVDALVNTIVGDNSDAVIRAAVVEFAVAHLYWLRVIAVRKQTLKWKLSELEPNARSKTTKRSAQIAQTLLMSDPELIKLSRYERRAFNARLHAAPARLMRS